MLFQIIPDNFFSPLASGNKIVYWDCICKLFAITSRQLAFGIERDILVDELIFYFDSAMAGEFRDETQGDQFKQEEPQENELQIKDSRSKANFVLRKLENCGWISIETDMSYVQRVNFKDYAVKIIKTLQDVSEEKKTEYQGYIYTIYNLVRAPGENQGLGLLQIMENTDQLITGLKTLNSNIKRYIDELTKHSTVAEILDALLNDYYTNVVDKAYHRLLTSDNVSKFRPEILERLEAKSRSESFLKAASLELAQLRELEENEAREEVLHMLHEVISTFRQMDDILDDINKKNSRYQRAAINRAKFLLTSSEDIRGQLKEIIQFLGEKADEERLDLRAVYDLDFLDRLIRLYCVEFLDDSSFYTPIEGRKEFTPQPVEVHVVDESLRREKVRKMKEQLDRVLSVDRIETYVELLLGDREAVNASASDLSSVENFIKLIYVRLYGQRKNVSYRIVPKEEVTVNGYRFRDFEIWRKKK